MQTRHRIKAAAYIAEFLIISGNIKFDGFKIVIINIFLLITQQVTVNASRAALVACVSSTRS